MNLEIASIWKPAGQETPRAAQLAPNGEWLAAAVGSEIILKRALTGEELSRLQAGQAPVLCLAVAPDSTWMLAGSDEADEWFTLRLYRLNGEQWGLACEFEAHRRTTAVAVAPDGATFASAGAEGLITFWSAGGDELWNSQPGAAIRGLAFSPDGTRLAVARQGQVEEWSREGALRWAFQTDPQAVAYSPQGETLLVSSLEGLHRLKEGAPEAFTPGCPFAGPELEAREHFSGQTWFGPGVSAAGPLRLRCQDDLELWRYHERLWRASPLEEMAVGPDRVLTTGRDCLVVRDLSGEPLAIHRSSGDKGKVCLVGSLGGWCTSTEMVVIEQESGEIRGRALRRNFAALVKGRLVFGRLVIYPTWTLEVDSPLEGLEELVAPKHAPRGDRLFLAVPTGGLRRARFLDGETEQSYFWTTMPDRQVVREPYLVGWTNTAIARWQIESGALVDLTPCPSMGLSGVAISPTGSRALVLQDDTARLYDLDKQEQLAWLAIDGPTVVAALDEQTYLVGTSRGQINVLRAG